MLWPVHSPRHEWFVRSLFPVSCGLSLITIVLRQLEAKLDEAQQETASALQRHSQVSEDLESTKLELSAATMRSAEAESAAEEADAQREASIEAERKAKAELQQSLAEIEQGTSEMEKLKQQNEVRTIYQFAIRNLPQCAGEPRHTSAIAGSGGSEQSLSEPTQGHANVSICLR